MLNFVSMRSILFKIILSISLFGYTQTKPNLDKVDDAVVLILIYDYKGEFQGHGSGFVIDTIGTIATNYHVVEGSYSMKVKFDLNGSQEIFEVDKVLSGDKNKDLATISIKNYKNLRFPYLKIAKTPAKKGDDCWAIGTPADIQYMNTITEGIVSNIYPFGINVWKGSMLQVSAPYTHGSSGGALVNKIGEAIGITCGGQADEDGARANINWAISTEELKNLPAINKIRLVDPNSIPCQLSFYTNSPYVGSVYLYVDGLYIGSFTKYFLNSTPQCGEEGTITRNLYTGIHSYTVYYANTRQSYYGTISLNPGQCQIFKVNGPNTQQSYYNPYTSLFKRKKFEDKKVFNWAIYSGLTISEDIADMSIPKIPIPIYIERSFKENRFSLRTRIAFATGNGQSLIYYPNIGEYLESINKSSYISSKVDFKFIWNRKFRLNYWFGPTLGFSSIKNYSSSNYTSWNPNTGQESVDKIDITENIFGLCYGIKIGTDAYITKRFYLSLDYGYVKYNSLGYWGLDYNLIVGYRFNLF